MSKILIVDDHPLIAQSLSSIISDSKINGMRPEDLQALSSRIKGVDNKAIEALVDSAYQHRHAESGFLGSGINSEKIAKDMLSEESVRWSEHIDGGKSFDFDITHLIKINSPENTQNFAEFFCFEPIFFHYFNCEFHKFVK